MKLEYRLVHWLVLMLARMLEHWLVELLENELVAEQVPWLD